MNQFSCRAARLNAVAADVAHIVAEIKSLTVARRLESEVVVEVHAAGLNPSDSKAAIGFMPHAVFPRTPGRDFAGVVVDGPSSLIGKSVFGSSGDLGMKLDGSVATHVVVEASAVVEKPATMTIEEAAGVGVPFVTAQEGFRRAGVPKPGETVVVMGVNGKVGQAAAQIASWKGARVIGVVRKAEPYGGHSSTPIDIIDSSAVSDVATTVRTMTDGRGADIVFNTVGDPYFAVANKSLSFGGRHILLSVSDPSKKIVEFNILEFYRNAHAFFGVNTLALSSTRSAELLQELLPGFASGALKAFPIRADSLYSLSSTAKALGDVLNSKERVIVQTLID